MNSARPVEELLQSLTPDELASLQSLKRKRRTSRKQEKTPDHLTPAELQRFFGAIESKRDQAMFRVMYCKGLRASEAGMIQMSDWNDREKLLTIRRLKGSRGGVFSMHDHELRAVRAWVRERGIAPGPMFPSRLGTAIERTQVWKLMRRYCQLAGIAMAKAHPHALKHSRGTHLLEETGKLHVVQDGLGHKNIANTTIYAQTGNRERAEAIALNQGKY